MQRKVLPAMCARKWPAKSPHLYLINMAKSQREGRIFLDYLRNDRMATAVAPLAPRARPGATVWMPLNWTEVKADLDPRRYTVRTVPDLLRKSTAWQELRWITIARRGNQTARQNEKGYDVIYF